MSVSHGRTDRRLDEDGLQIARNVPLVGVFDALTFSTIGTQPYKVRRRLT